MGCSAHTTEPRTQGSGEENNSSGICKQFCTVFKKINNFSLQPLSQGHKGPREILGEVMNSHTLLSSLLQKQH